MPSTRTNPPEKTDSVVILRGCIANGTPQEEGTTIKVSAATAALLIGTGQAARANDKTKAKTKKKAAKSAPVVNAER